MSFTVEQAKTSKVDGSASWKRISILEPIQKEKMKIYSVALNGQLNGFIPRNPGVAN